MLKKITSNGALVNECLRNEDGSLLLVFAAILVENLCIHLYADRMRGLSARHLE